jgi:hypothetical protein
MATCDPRRRLSRQQRHPGYGYDLRLAFNTAKTKARVEVSVVDANVEFAN